MRRALLAVALLPAFACAPTVDPEDVEGIERSADDLFRYMDYPQAPVDETFAVLERIVKVHFAGGAVISDAAARKVETAPRPFAALPQRITLFGQVSVQGDGSRVELFAKIERIRDDLREGLTDPWSYVGADAELENLIFRELWDALVVAKRVEAAEGRQPIQPAAPVPPTDP